METTKNFFTHIRFPRISPRPALPRPHLPSRPDSAATFCIHSPERVDECRREVARMVNKMF